MLEQVTMEGRTRRLETHLKISKRSQFFGSPLAVVRIGLRAFLGEEVQTSLSTFHFNG